MAERKFPNKSIMILQQGQLEGGQPRFTGTELVQLRGSEEGFKRQFSRERSCERDEEMIKTGLGNVLMFPLIICHNFSFHMISFFFYNIQSINRIVQLIRFVCLRTTKITLIP